MKIKEANISFHERKKEIIKKEMLILQISRSKKISCSTLEVSRKIFP